MIFQNIDFHNVEEMEPCAGGWLMYRVPHRVREKLNDRARQLVCSYSTGVELRFKIKGDSATLILKAEEAKEAQTAYIYYGTFQGGWEYSSKTVFTHDTRITISAPDHLDRLEQIYREQRLGFHPAVVRLVLPYGTCVFAGVEGEVEPPEQEKLPDQTYLAYGSSITHGSLALAPPYSYPFRIAQKMNSDYINLGMAGCAHLEKEMAEYLISRKDWDFGSVEMGINMIEPEFTVEEFESRVREFLKIMASDSRPVFVTSLFGYNGEYQRKAEQYRKIVAECAKPYLDRNINFIDGLKLLDNPAFISQDMTHPSLEGLERIAKEWYGGMRKVL